MGPVPLHYWGFTITIRHTTLGKSPLDEWPARRRDLYLTTHGTHKRQTLMPQAGFEPASPASEPPHTHALDRAATGIGDEPSYLTVFYTIFTITYTRICLYCLPKPCGMKTCIFQFCCILLDAVTRFLSRKMKILLLKINEFCFINKSELYWTACFVQ
jgi:hypothetical protein